MLELSEIQTTDSARSSAALRGLPVLPGEAEPASEGEGGPSDVFTPGATRWPSDVPIRLRLADPVRQEANRRRLLKALAKPGPLWDPARHPESEGEGGSAAWVKELRREAEQAFKKRTGDKDGG